MSPKTKMIGFVCVAAAIWIFADYQRDAARMPAASQAPHHNAAPDVTFTSLQGDDTASLKDYHGKFVLLNMWATWCAPCVKELPMLLEFAASHPNKLQLITLSLDKTAALPIQFIDALNEQNDELPDNIWHAWDADRTIAQNMFQTFRLPESILIDGQGRMVKKYVGEIRIPDLLEIEKMMEQSADPS